MNGFLLRLLFVAFMTITTVVYPAIKDILPSIFNQSTSSATTPKIIQTTIPISIPILNINDI